MGYVSTGMGDRFSALLQSLMVLRLALVDQNPFRPCYFYPTAFKGYAGIVFTHVVRMGGQVVGWREKACLDCISETLRGKMLILGRDIGWGLRCATSWCDLDLT